MEVTTVSPSPASPTEWDDLCETDVTNVAIHSVTLLISLCGLLGNGAVLFIVKCRNVGIFALALVDFLFLLFTAPSALLFLVEDMSCSLVVPLLYLNFLFQLSWLSCNLTLALVTLRSNVVYMFKLYELCCCCDLPECLLWFVLIVQYLAFYIVLFFSPALCSLHQQEDCQTALISMITVILFLLAAPRVIRSTVNFIKAKWGSQQQQPKRRDIIVFLMVLFIILFSYFNLLQRLGYTVVSSEVFFLLNCIHNSLKPFIYFLAGGFRRPCSLRSLQLSLLSVFDDQEEEAAHRNDAPMDTGV